MLAFLRLPAEIPISELKSKPSRGDLDSSSSTVERLKLGKWYHRVIWMVVGDLLYF